MAVHTGRAIMGCPTPAETVLGLRYVSAWRRADLSPLMLSPSGQSVVSMLRFYAENGPNRRAR